MPKKPKDHRSAERTSLGTPAWIRIDNGFSVRSCVVVDMSSSGVRLVLDDARAVAAQFNLLLRRDAIPGRRCRVMWRSGSEIGAEFF